LDGKDLLPDGGCLALCNVMGGKPIVLKPGNAGVSESARMLGTRGEFFNSRA
jgi:hypothetical protein